ncbi:MAG: NAD(P)H-hydrate dehydratase [Acidaminococcaceae bacterium]|nr:NAD(P)H-hydrate dehydratase [Acidaminococcaceae bacterium]
MQILLAEEMRALDRAAEEEIGIPGLVLMENAGRAVADASEKLLGSCSHKKIVIFAGKGNNGGDGSGAGRWLHNRGAELILVLAGLAEELSGSAADELQYYLTCSAQLLEVTDADDNLQFAEIEKYLIQADLIIDGLLGTGFNGKMRSLFGRLCRCINQAKANNPNCRVLAIDIPTGVNADTGAADKDAVRADMTVTMALPKLGLYLYPGADCVGELRVADIGMPASLLKEAAGNRFLITKDRVKAMLPERPKNAHKGTAGRVAVAAGSYGYVGAAALCSFAAVKGGAGLVTLLTPENAREVLAVKLTEVMVKGLPAAEDPLVSSAAMDVVSEVLEKADVLAIGPGFGISEETGNLVREILATSHVPCVIDADAITALQNHTELLSHMLAEKVLTPHPGEMARITGLPVATVERERVEVARSYAEKWQAVIVLKGVPTVVALPDGTVFLNTTGTPAMATGGSGDVLTGLISALIGQGLPVADAAVAGVYLHGLAGELAAKGSIGLAASELLSMIPEARKTVYTKPYSMLE